MHAAANPHRAGIGAELAAGAEGALETMPFLVVAGLIAFAPMGEAMSGIGILAAFVSAILAGLWTLGLADRRGLVAGPSLGLALMIGAALQTLVQRQMLGPAEIGTALALGMALTLASGLLMAVVAVAGIGRLAPLMPYPVLSGLRNGTALLLILEQAHAAMGMEGAHDHGFHLADIHPGAMVVAVVTVLAMFVRLRPLRAVPPILRALVAGMVVHHVLALLPGGEAWMGPLMPLSRPQPVLLHDLGAGFAALARLPAGVLSEVLLPTLLSMVFLGLLETVASASALHSETGQRGSGRRDLLAVALANLTGGAVGALPAAGSLEETVVVAHAPLRQARRTALLRCAVLLLLALLALPLLSRLPAAVLAGIIIATALEVSDIRALRQMLFAARAGRSHRVEGIGNLLIVLTVAATAAVFGLVIAVLAGALLALLVFVADMAEGPVRRRYVNPIGRSRTRRGDHETSLLLREGWAIEVIELQGALFFGSTDQVAGAIEAALAGGARYIVLDLHRVHRMDLSGARGLLDCCARAWQGGTWVVFAGARPGVPAWDYLRDRGLDVQLPDGRGIATLEDAIENAEARLLADRLGSLTDPVLDGESALASLGIPAAARPALLGHTAEVSFAAGDTFIHAGDTSRTLFILLQGRVEVSLRLATGGDGERRAVRIATLAPGTLFGEMALLSEAPRSADLVAVGEVRCLQLDPAGLAALREGEADSAWYLLRAIAMQIELNLRLANAAIASYEE